MTIGIDVSRRESDTLVTITGDIDLQTAPLLESVLADIDSDIVIDLTACGFLDSTALGLFVGTDNRLRARGGVMSLVCINPRLLRVFHITHLDAVWPIMDQLPPAAPEA